MTAEPLIFVVLPPACFHSPATQSNLAHSDPTQSTYPTRAHRQSRVPAKRKPGGADCYSVFGAFPQDQASYLLVYPRFTLDLPDGSHAEVGGASFLVRIEAAPIMDALRALVQSPTSTVYDVSTLPYYQEGYLSEGSYIFLLTPRDDTVIDATT